MHIIRMAWIPGDLNLADLFTKTTLPANKKHGFIMTIFNNNVEVLDRKEFELGTMGT